MKRIFTLLFILYALSSQAQYLPNGSFDSWKGSGNAGSTYQSSNGNEMRKRPGDEPTSWYGSSINQKVKVVFANTTKEETLIYKSTGRNGSAVKLQNKWVGAAGIGSNAPAFISFATPWVYAVSTVSNCDGGMYGGMSFTHRPDAIKGWFKRTGGTGEKAHIIVYLWKGTFKNNITSAKSNDTKDDTDRAVMGMVSSTGNGVRIASCDYTFTTTTNNDWQEITVPLNYENDYIPEKVNVIISSGDYWTRGNVNDGSILEADDVNFVYYSELASLTYNGKNYFQQGKTSYTIDELYDESKLSVTSNGRGAVIEKSFDSSTNVLTITVKGNDYAARSNSKPRSYSLSAILAHAKNLAAASGNFHTYTVQFKTEEPLSVVAVTPDEVVESLKTITIEYSDEIEGKYSESASSKIYVGSNSNTASFSVSGKLLTITLDNAIIKSGNYALTIPSGLITRKSNGAAVVCGGEIGFTVEEPHFDAPLNVVAVTPNGTVESLKTITVEYSDEIEGTYSAGNATKIYVGSSNNTASFSVSSNVLTITLDNAITTSGDYALTIPAGLVTRKVNGEAVTCNGEIKFKVEVAPLEVVAVTPAAGVQSLQTITVEYSDEIAGTYNESASSKIYVGSSSNTASFSVSGKVLTITLDNAVTTPGDYALTIPAGLVTRKLNGEAVTCNGEISFTVKRSVDYTPSYTGAKSRTERRISSVTMSSAKYPNAASNTFTVDNSGNPCYNDYSASVLMKAAAGESVRLAINADDATTWMNAFVYIDAQGDGFTASIADGSNWRPADDLVSYSFYNNNGSSDASGWNSVGESISGDARSTVALPAFVVPAQPGVYRVRVKLDWCNIDPNGDSDGKFGDFMDNGGQIVDFMLEVTGDANDDSEPNPGEDVDYTPTNTGTRNYAERNIDAVTFASAQYGDVRYELTANEVVSEYLDLTGRLEFLAVPGEQVSVTFDTDGSWINHYIYIDADYNGFTASIENGSKWRPAGDLVSYSFYNNGGSSDASGWNSDGQTVSGNDRSYPVLPSFEVPAKPGRYRLRLKQDWCSIDPDGDSDSNFGGTFSNYGGQIIDVILRVSDPTGIENVVPESGEKVIYDIQGRRLDEITKPGIYIVNGKKVLVK